MKDTRICWCMRARYLQSRLTTFNKMSQVRLAYAVSKMRDNNLWFANSQFIGVV